MVGGPIGEEDLRVDDLQAMCAPHRLGASPMMKQDRLLAWHGATDRRFVPLLVLASTRGAETRLLTTLPPAAQRTPCRDRSNR